MTLSRAKEVKALWRDDAKTTPGDFTSSSPRPAHLSRTSLLSRALLRGDTRRVAPSDKRMGAPVPISSGPGLDDTTFDSAAGRGGGVRRAGEQPASQTELRPLAPDISSNLLSPPRASYTHFRCIGPPARSIRPAPPPCCDASEQVTAEFHFPELDDSMAGKTLWIRQACGWLMHKHAQLLKVSSSSEVRFAGRLPQPQVQNCQATPATHARLIVANFNTPPTSGGHSLPQAASLTCA